MTNDSGPESGSRASDNSPDSARPYLAVACILVAIEGCALLGMAVAELTAVAPDRVGLGVSTAIFFLLIGIGLCGAAYGLWRRVTWARGPVVFAQLIALGLAWSFRDVSPRAIAAALLVVAIAVLVAVLAPATTAALTDDPERPPGG
ncbi:MAG: hypothetical protein ACRDO7_07740 [Nocardioidaceae bacterium]